LIPTFWRCILLDDLFLPFPALKLLLVKVLYRGDDLLEVLLDQLLEAGLAIKTHPKKPT
jgi:hypothetical protein